METSVSASAATFDCRAAFAETLIDLAQSAERIVAVCTDSGGSSNLGLTCDGIVAASLELKGQ